MLACPDLSGVEYIARCPFSLTRLVKVAPDGRVVYHGSHAKCIRFPELGQEMDLRAGMRRNYQVFDPLDFLASVTQHIPNKGEHQIRYYGHYSNKCRGMQAKTQGNGQTSGETDPLTPYQLKCRITWAALIRCVYEVDPLECPKCGATMKIIGFVERDAQSSIRSQLLQAGLWRETPTRAPPPGDSAPALEVAEPSLDYHYFDPDAASGLKAVPRVFREHRPRPEYVRILTLPLKSMHFLLWKVLCGRRKEVQNSGCSILAGSDTRVKRSLSPEGI